MWVQRQEIRLREDIMDWREMGGRSEAIRLYHCINVTFCDCYIGK